VPVLAAVRQREPRRIPEAIGCTDYVNFDIEKSPDDIIAMYRSAQKFVAFLRNTLLEKTEASPRAEPAAG